MFEAGTSQKATEESEKTVLKVHLTGDSEAFLDSGETRKAHYLLLLHFSESQCQNRVCGGGKAFGDITKGYC